MIKKVLTLFSVFSLVLVSFLTVHLSTYSQSPEPAPEKILYQLPYPGLLPDHPLYFIKDIRDQILDFATREPLKKAELYLHLSDKKVAMSLALARKGKYARSREIYRSAEDMFSQIPKILTQSKDQGVSPTSAFTTKLKLSNTKHREIGEILLKEVPQGEIEKVNTIIKQNQDISAELNKW